MQASETPPPTPMDLYRSRPWYHQHLPRSARRGKTVAELHSLREATYLLLHPADTPRAP